jgi:hypothetical protein
MKTKRIMFVSLLFLLALISSVQANSVFVIEPSTEVTQEVQSNGCKSIGGNVSVVSGSIDLYVTDPSGATLLYYENTSFTKFAFNTTQNGTYTFHLANRRLDNNVTATLWYGKNFELILYGNIQMHWETASIMETAVVPPSSNPSIGWLTQILLAIFGMLLSVLGAILKDEIRRKIQKWRDGKPPSYDYLSVFLRLISNKHFKPVSALFQLLLV